MIQNYKLTEEAKHKMLDSLNSFPCVKDQDAVDIQCDSLKIEGRKITFSRYDQPLVYLDLDFNAKDTIEIQGIDVRVPFRLS